MLTTQAVDHPRCIKLLEVREDDEAIHLVEELAGGGELFDRIIECGQFSEKDAVHLVVTAVVDVWKVDRWAVGVV